MPRKPNPPPDDKEQSKRFLEAALAVDADKTGANFKRAVQIIIPAANKKSKLPKSG